MEKITCLLEINWLYDIESHKNESNCILQKGYQPNVQHTYIVQERVFVVRYV